MYKVYDWSFVSISLKFLEFQNKDKFSEVWILKIVGFKNDPLFYFASTQEL